MGSSRKDLLKRITTNPDQCGGKPCIRGIRVRVSDVVDLIANGLTHQEVVDELPYLELEDVKAALHYAAYKVSHTVLAA